MLLLYWKGKEGNNMTTKILTDKGILTIKSYTLKNSKRSYVYFVHLHGSRMTYRIMDSALMCRILANLNQKGFKKNMAKKKIMIIMIMRLKIY